MSEQPEGDPRVVAIIQEIARRVSKGEAVTKELVDQLPAGLNVEMDAVVTLANGTLVAGVISIMNGKVAFRETASGKPS